MIQPTKGIDADKALLTVGAQILQQLREPATVSEVWHSTRAWRQKNGYESNLPFWWFVLALDTLFALGVIQYVGGVLARRRADAPSAL